MTEHSPAVRQRNRVRRAHGRVAGVLFDLWNTLVAYPASEGSAAIGALATILRIDEAVLSAALLDNYPLMRGEFEGALRGVCERLGLAESLARVPQATMDWRLRHRALLTPRPHAVTTLDELRRRQIRTGLVSNCSSDLAEIWPDSELASHLDAVVLSCVDGVVKPDPASYRLALDRLGLSAGECLYVGDTAGELVGASAVGLRPFLLLTGEEAHAQQWHGERIAYLHEILTYASVP